MALPDVVSREQWLDARVRLLAEEKEFTRRRDALNADRRRLPMVAIDKDYAFDGPSGQVGLLDLFDGCTQLVLQHVMFDPNWDAACDGCTAGLDETAPGVLQHMRSRDTAFAAVSRAPLAKLAAFKAKKAWDFPWFSSYGSDFNYDFQVTLNGGGEYNYRVIDSSGELPGVSCFLRDGDSVFHTYSTFARGTDQLGNSYSWLDLTALGRQEDWEEPKGRVSKPHGADPTFTD